MNEKLQMAAGLPQEKSPPPKLKTLAQFERDYIEMVLHLSRDNIPRAAKILDISPSTLYRKRARWA
ncbi:MAG: helix-turn-helix domain-containing protein [Alphaproteobacteria bacterium]